MKLRLATTHPIQYQAPWFRALARVPEIDFEVAFAALPDARAVGTGFGVDVAWDLPLTDGYPWRELERRSAEVELTRFNGLRLREPGAFLAERPDALVVTGWNSRALVELALAARRRRIPVIVRGDSHALRRRPLAVRLGHRALLRLYAAFLVVGKLNREFYLGNGVTAERLFEAPHFVDNVRFAREAQRVREEGGGLRARLAIAESATVLLFAGKLQPVKNVELLLAALGALAAPGTPLHLLVVGDGDLRTALDAQAEAQALPVSFVGFLNQSEMPFAYAAADLLVLPSRSETWGLAVNEAMASSLPALVSDAVGCAPDLIVAGETGWTFPSGDRDALARRIADAGSNRERLRAMGENAARHVGERFTVERAVAGTLAALRFVCAPR